MSLKGAPVSKRHWHSAVSIKDRMWL